MMPRLMTLMTALALGWLAGLAGSAAAQQSGPSDVYFEVEALNPGLAGEPRTSRDTPQATLESFLDLAKAGEYARAAHLLDLSSIAVADQPSAGRRLARQLEKILERKVWINWEGLPDRPDGLDITASPKDVLAGSPRRSLRIALIELDDRPVPVRAGACQTGRRQTGLGVCRPVCREHPGAAPRPMARAGSSGRCRPGRKKR
jgi:MscS family membrane protein